jgi:hypothetical protein
LLFKYLIIILIEFIKIEKIVIIGDWGLGIGDWGLGIGPNPQSPIPNPQSPIYSNY